MFEKPLEWVIRNESELDLVAAAVCADLALFRVFLLNGPMGSGKTTLMRHIGAMLGSEDEISSPTFSIANEYKLREPLPHGPDRFYHMDLYRLEDPEELFEIGFVEYLDSDLPVFIEWPGIASAWYEGTEVWIDIRALEDGSRKISILPFHTFDEHTWVTK